MVPSLSIFLDVDDLRTGTGFEYVDVSSVMVVYITDGYFFSPNCMRELLRAIFKRVRLCAVVEHDPSKGGLSREQMTEQLAYSHAQMASSGLAADLASWGFADPPSVAAILDMLVGPHARPVEWARMAPYQEIALRFIAERVLEHDQKPTFTTAELVREQVVLPPPRRGGFHVFVSESNPGAAEVVADVARTFNLVELRTTSDATSMAQCTHILVYLTSRTWKSSDAAAKFAMEVEKAIDVGCHLLLAHETPGSDNERRHAVAFDAFLPARGGRAGHASGGCATPARLLELGLYSEIAVPLKGDEIGDAFRRSSLALLAQAMADMGRDGEDPAMAARTGAGHGVSGHVAGGEVGSAVGARLWRKPRMLKWMLSPKYRSTRQAQALSNSAGATDGATPHANGTIPAGAQATEPQLGLTVRTSRAELSQIRSLQGMGVTFHEDCDGPMHDADSDLTDHRRRAD